MIYLFLFILDFSFSLSPTSYLPVLSKSVPLLNLEDEELLSPESLFSEADITRWVERGLSYDALNCFVRSSYAQTMSYLTLEQQQAVQTNWTCFIDLITSYDWSPSFLEKVRQSAQDTCKPTITRSFFPHKVSSKIKEFIQKESQNKQKWMEFLKIIEDLQYRVQENKNERGISSDSNERKIFYTQIINSLDEYLSIIFANEEKNEKKLREDIEYFCAFINTFNNACPQRLSHIPKILYLKTMIKKMELQNASYFPFCLFLFQMTPLYIEHLIGKVAGAVLIYENRYFQNYVFRGVHAQESYKYYAQELGFPSTYRRIKEPFFTFTDEEIHKLTKINTSILTFLKGQLSFSNFILEFTLPGLLNYDSWCAIDSEIIPQGIRGLGASVTSHAFTRNNSIVDELKSLLHLNQFQMNFTEESGKPIDFPDLNQWFIQKCLPTCQSVLSYQEPSSIDEHKLWFQIMENYVLPPYLAQRGVHYFINHPQCHTERNSLGYLFLFHLSSLHLDVSYKQKLLTMIFESYPQIPCQEEEEGHTLLSVMLYSPFVNNKELSCLIQFVLYQLCSEKSPQVLRSFWDPSNISTPYTHDSYCQSILVSLLENRLPQHHQMVCQYTKERNSVLERSDYYRFSSRSDSRFVYADVIRVLLNNNSFYYARPLESLQYILTHLNQFYFLFNGDDVFPSLLSLYQFNFLDKMALSRLINEFFPSYYKDKSSQKVLNWIQESKNIFVNLARNNDISILDVLFSFLEKNFDHSPDKVLKICEVLSKNSEKNNFRTLFLHRLIEANSTEFFCRLCQVIRKLCLNNSTRKQGVKWSKKLFSERENKTGHFTFLHRIAQQKNTEFFDVFCELMSSLCLNEQTRKFGINMVSSLFSIQDDTNQPRFFLHAIFDNENTACFSQWCQFMSSLCLNSSTKKEGFDLFRELLLLEYGHYDYTFLHRVAKKNSLTFFNIWCEFMTTLCLNNSTKKEGLTLIRKLLSSRLVGFNGETFLHTVERFRHIDLWNQTDSFLNKIDYLCGSQLKMQIYSIKDFGLGIWGETAVFRWNNRFQENRQKQPKILSPLTLPDNQRCLYLKLVQSQDNPFFFFKTLEEFQKIWNISFSTRSAFLTWRENKKERCLLQVIFDFYDRSSLPSWLIKLFVLDNLPVHNYLQGEFLIWWKTQLLYTIEEFQEQKCLNTGDQQFQTALVEQGYLQFNSIVHRFC